MSMGSVEGQKPLSHVNTYFPKAQRKFVSQFGQEHPHVFNSKNIGKVGVEHLTIAAHTALHAQLLVHKIIWHGKKYKSAKFV